MFIFQDKKVAILGFGIEGKDLCDFLVSCGARITVFDQKPEAELGDIEVYKKGGVGFITGLDYLNKGLSGFEYIFRSPGIYRYIPEIVEAEKDGAIISSATKLFFDLCPGKIIGVTGTKGKGTTSTLIYEILKNGGKSVFLAGNIGKPMLGLLPQLNNNSLVILELSSFQLHDLEKSPHIAVVLFVVAEHLNIHKDIDEYIAAKSNIVKFQTENDFAILDADNEISSSFSKLTKAIVRYYSKDQKTNGAYVFNGEIYVGDVEIGKTENLQIIGRHNWENVCAAASAGRALGVDVKAMKEAIFSFKGLEHRLELVATFNGVKYYNDSFSTTPETTIAAIKSFSSPIILIAGGSEKGSDYTEMGIKIAGSTVKTLVLIGDMAEKIKNVVSEAGYKGEMIFRPSSMPEIVDEAHLRAKPGDIILLSPACASFGMFLNYKDRGMQFKSNVGKIIGKNKNFDK